jgi:hypothetical protein
MSAGQESSRILFWPLWVAIGLPLLLIVLNSSPLASNFVFVMIGLPALLLMWAALGLWALIVTILRLRWSSAQASIFWHLFIFVMMQATSFIFC